MSDSRQDRSERKVRLTAWRIPSAPGRHRRARNERDDQRGHGPGRDTACRPSQPHRRRQPGRAAHAGRHRRRARRPLHDRPAPSARPGDVRCSGPGRLRGGPAQLEAYFAGRLASSTYRSRRWARSSSSRCGPGCGPSRTARPGATASSHVSRPPAASRAVGLANGRNPIGIIVPCHRVVGSTGPHRVRRRAGTQAVPAGPRTPRPRRLSLLRSRRTGRSSCANYVSSRLASRDRGTGGVGVLLPGAGSTSRR